MHQLLYHIDYTCSLSYVYIHPDPNTYPNYKDRPDHIMRVHSYMYSKVCVCVCVCVTCF